MRNIKLLFCVFFSFFTVNFLFSQESNKNNESMAMDNIDNPIVFSETNDFIIHYKKWGFSSFDTFQFADSEVPLTNKELNKILLPVEGNKKLMKKATFWKCITYTLIGSFIGTGIASYYSENDSDAEIITGSLSLISLLAFGITNEASVSYRMQAIDNYNLSLTK